MIADIWANGRIARVVEFGSYCGYSAVLIARCLGPDGHLVCVEMDPESVGTPDEEITTVVDVSKYVSRKERAAACHRTQIGGDDPFAWIPEAVRTRFLSAEHLVRAQPVFDPSREGEEDELFGGVYP